MDRLLSDDFELHDKMLDQVCKKFKFEVVPSWQHKWFYRFLQISFSYRFVHNCETKIAKGSSPVENYKDFIPDYDYVRHVHNAFSDVWFMDFIRWWAVFGQFQFNSNEKSSINEIAFFRSGKKYSDDELDSINSDLKSHITKWLDTPSTPDMLLIGLPLNFSKKELSLKITNVVDKYTFFPQDDVAYGNFFIYKSKIKEGAVRDCYRTLEIKMRNPEISLIDLAVKSNTLKTSLAGIKDGANVEFVNSVQVGVRRQLKLAVDLAESAARGLFPCVDRSAGWMHPLYLNYHNLYKLGITDVMGGQIFNEIQSVNELKSQDINKLLNELPLFVEHAKKQRFFDVSRSY